MAKQNLNIGSSANDGTGDSLRDGAIKLNSVINELYTALGNDTNLQINIGSPSTGQFLKWDGSAFVEGGLASLTENLDVNGFQVSSTNNGDVVIKPNGSGSIKFWAGGTGDALTYIDGTTGKLQYTNHYDTTGDLPAASNHHGMFAHVHAENHGYFAHGGSWIQLIDSGSSIGELNDVDLTVGGGQSDGQVLKWSAANSKWEPQNDLASSGGGGGTTQNLFESVNADSGTTTASAATDTLTIAGGTNISTSIAGDTVTVSMTGALGDPDQNLFSTIGSDSGNKTANSTSTTVNFVGGTGISTAIAGDNLTITNDSPNVTQNLFATFTGDSGSQAAASATTSFAFAGGNGISTAVSGNTATITAQLSLTSGQSLGEGNNLIVDSNGTFETVASPTIGWVVNGNTTNGWSFDGPGVSSSTWNPTIYLMRGFTYRFNNASGASHPFKLRTTSGGSAITNGTSGNDEGVQFYTIPMSLAAGTTYVYQCGIPSHTAMIGNMVIV